MNALKGNIYKNKESFMAVWSNWRYLVQN